MNFSAGVLGAAAKSRVQGRVGRVALCKPLLTPDLSLRQSLVGPGPHGSKDHVGHNAHPIARLGEPGKEGGETVEVNEINE
jgi:hypothetical protein